MAQSMFLWNFPNSCKKTRPFKLTRDFVKNCSCNSCLPWTTNPTYSNKINTTKSNPQQRFYFLYTRFDSHNASNLPNLVNNFLNAFFLSLYQKENIIRRINYLKHYMMRKLKQYPHSSICNTQTSLIFSTQRTPSDWQHILSNIFLRMVFFSVALISLILTKQIPDFPTKRI